MFWLVLFAMLALLATGTAVAYALGASSVLAFIASDNLRYLAIVPQRISFEPPGWTEEGAGYAMVWFSAALPIAIVVILVHVAASLAAGKPP